MEMVIVAATIGPSTWWSHTRSFDWSSELALFERGYAISPRDLRTSNNLAMALLATPVGGQAQQSAVRRRAVSLLKRAVEDQPQFQYLAAANLAIVAWGERDPVSTLHFGWLAVNASVVSGVPERLPCSVAATLAAAYLGLAQDYGVSDLDVGAPEAVQAGGMTQTSWRRQVTTSATWSRSRTGVARPSKQFVSAAGLAHTAAKVSMDAGCYTPENLHVSASSMLIMGDEVAPADSPVVLPVQVTSPGTGAALFDYLQSLRAAGLGIRSIKASDASQVDILVASELAAVPTDAPVVGSSVSYNVPGAGQTTPGNQLVVQLVSMPVQRAGAAPNTASQAAFSPIGERSDFIPGAPSAGAGQTASTLNMMSTACKALAQGVSAQDAVAAANLASMADGLARLAITLQPSVPSYRSNLATLWVHEAPTLALVSGTLDSWTFLEAALAEAQHAVEVSHANGQVSSAPEAYHSNVGFVLEAQATFVEAEEGDAQGAQALLRQAMSAYTLALELVPGHVTIAENKRRVADKLSAGAPLST
jgi:hypothetical protein